MIKRRTVKISKWTKSPPETSFYSLHKIIKTETKTLHGDIFRPKAYKKL